MSPPPADQTADHPGQRPLPCGEWPSPLDAATLAAAALRLGSPAIAADGSRLWLEGRPGEGGRTTLVRLRGLAELPVDLTPAPFDVRSRVHEYGGGAFTTFADDVVFVDGTSGGLFRSAGTEAPALLAAAPPGWRFGDLVADPARNRILAVVEHHRDGAPTDNFIAAVDARSGATDVVIAGADFYASPTPSPDGGALAFITWNHPHLPWDAGALCVGHLSPEGRVQSVAHVAGDARGSAQQPAYADDGTLYFLYEDPRQSHPRWNLFRWRAGRDIEAVATQAGELGLPPWQLGTRTWALLDGGTAIAAAIANGTTSLVTIDLATGTTEPLPVALASVGHLAARGGQVVLQAGLPDRPGGIFQLERDRGGLRLLRATLTLGLDPALVAHAEPITFATSEGDEAHGLFYAPRNPAARPRAGEKPPLIVIAHSGPTAAASPAFSPLVQFWTTRGLAVLDVNYRGSTGYGRTFRQRLQQKWGVYDVDDCAFGARALIASGRVDGRRVAIRGSSAGGFTALCALTSSEVFAAGASLYGVSDLGRLAADTHKFESRYLDGLVGPWPAAAEIYAARSPINQADRLRCPVIFFQGLDDKVVPPNQAETFAEVLRAKGLPVELITFAGEQHGFRRAETLKTVYRAELAFYGRAFGFRT